MRMVFVYMIVSNFMGKPPQRAVPPAAGDSGAVGAAAGVNQGSGASGAGGHVAHAPSPPLTPLINAWPPRQLMDLRVYVTENEEFSDFSDSTALVWQETSLGYGRDEALQSTRVRNVSLTPSRRVLHNQTLLWAHIYLSKAGSSPDPTAREHRPLCTASSHHPLIRVVRRKKPKATRNLLSGEPEEALSEAELAEREAAPEIEWIPHWKPAITISVVEDFTAYSPNSVPPQIRPALKVDTERSRYLPVLFINECAHMLSYPHHARSAPLSRHLRAF